jgi:hypothetical protein
MAVADNQQPQEPPAQELQQAVATAVVHLQQRQDHLQEQLNNLLWQEQRAPQPGNERHHVSNDQRD